MKAYLYRLDCLTNLHVGSGDNNYSIIDKEVERDPVTGEPTIHASGIKGALRDYCEVVELPKGTISKDKICEIFGQEVKNNSVIQPGKYKFLSASLAARPLRVSNGDQPYVNATSPILVENIKRLVDSFGINFPLSSVSEGTNLADAKIEGESLNTITDKDEKESLNNLIGGKYAVFNSLSEYALPTIARNQLNNGKSDNLWYEEFVPHESIFYFIVLIPDDEDNDLPIHGKVVQFGGNASVGYGYCGLREVANSLTKVADSLPEAAEG